MLGRHGAYTGGVAHQYDRLLAAVGDSWRPSLACVWWPGALRDPDAGGAAARGPLMLQLQRDGYGHVFTLSEAALVGTEVDDLAARFVAQAKEHRARDGWPPVVD